MWYVRCLLVCVVFAMVGGCGHKLADCKKQNQKLSAELTRSQQALADEKSAHKAEVDKLNAEVEKLNAESAEMQKSAMESMTKMLKKDQEVQETLKAKVAELEGKISAQSAENTKLSSELAAAKKALEEAKAAAAAPAAPAPAAK
jgi:chromosome segregation ATPase